MTEQITRDEALIVLEQPPLSEEEGRLLFSEVAKRLEISEEELTKYYDLPKCTECFRSRALLYKIGIKLYEMLGIEKRIRK